MSGQVFISAIGTIGPGFDEWPTLAAALRGESTLAITATNIASPAILPPAERRRVGKITKLSIACGMQAIEQASADATQLATVFTTSGGDGENCDILCDALTQPEREISPTRFHNSVHNAPSGYWSIATRSMAPSTTLCAYDGSFAAGLLETFTQVITQKYDCLLVASDTPYGGALGLARPTPDSMGVALLLTHKRLTTSFAALRLETGETSSPAVPVTGFEHMQQQLPAARSLPLLQLLAKGESGTAHLEYLTPLFLRVHVHSLKT